MPILFFLLSLCFSNADCQKQSSVEDRLDRVEGLLNKMQGKDGVIEINGPHRSEPNYMGWGHPQREGWYADFNNMDRMVGYLWYEKRGRMGRIFTTGRYVANIFAELQDRCIRNRGRPMAFAIRIRDF